MYSTLGFSSQNISIVVLVSICFLIPQNSILSKLLYKGSLLVKDAQNYSKGLFGSAQSSILHSAFCSCSIPTTPQLLDVQWFTPQITVPAGRVGVMCINCMHTPLSLAVPALLKSSPVYWRMPKTMFISFTCILWQVAGKAAEHGKEQRS